MIFFIFLIFLITGEFYLKNYFETNYTKEQKQQCFFGKILLRKYHNYGAFLNFMEKKKAPKGRCECCLYYEFDESFGCMACSVPLDEDESLHYSRPGSVCPYFRWYDEYKSVQKQN